MKNIFKFFGIAVLACSMMTACGDKNEEENNNNENNNPPAETSSYTLKWDNAAPELAYAEGATNGSVWLFQAALRAEGTSVYFPYFVVYMSGTTTEDFAPAATSCEAYIETYYQAGGENYGDWQGEETNSVNVTRIDPAAGKLSANMSIKMYSLTDFINADSNLTRDEVMALCARKNLDLNFTNYNFEVVTGK